MATPAKLRLSELTGGEARAALAANPVILLPLGSHEDQGPHAPMGDYLTADAVAERIARQATADGTATFVAPVVPFGGADYFGTMPGGIALQPATLRALLDDMLACLLRHGLTRLLVINGHSGNVEPIHHATLAVWQRHGVMIPSFYLWQVAYGLLPAILGPERAARSAGHGADPLTSVTMHLLPHLIRADLVPDGPAPPGEALGLPVTDFGLVTFDGVQIHVPVEMDQIAANGVWSGDPRLCRAETGDALTARLVTIGARLASHLARR